MYVFNIPETSTLAGFVEVMGFVYFGIGAVLTVIHDRHMAKRTRAGERENELIFFSPGPANRQCESFFHATEHLFRALTVATAFVGSIIPTSLPGCVNVLTGPRNYHNRH